MTRELFDWINKKVPPDGKLILPEVFYGLKYPKIEIEFHRPQTLGLTPVFHFETGDFFVGE